MILGPTSEIQKTGSLHHK